MEWYHIVLIVVGALLVSGIAGMLIYMIPLSKKIYFEQLVRTSPEKWGRVCSATWHPENSAMWDEGLKWAAPLKGDMDEVEIRNDGLRLVAELYKNHGSKKCVIILPGRCESLMYSYYFAPPYYESGFAVLAIDTRAHGNSEGIYNTIGERESLDVLAWCRLLIEKYGMEEIYIHGICVGTAAGLYALESKDCPPQVKGLITEGCFTSFRESFRTHMIAQKKPRFPILDIIMLQIMKHTGSNTYRRSPMKTMPHIKDKRMLFLFGKEDIYSLPPKSQKLYEACASTDKAIVWFPVGSHSHLRINNPELYDSSIKEFLARG